MLQSSESRKALDDKGMCPAWRLERSGRPPRSDCALPTIATTPDHHCITRPQFAAAAGRCRCHFPTRLCAAHLVGPQGSEASEAAGYLRCVAAIGTVPRCHATAAQLDCEESSLAQNWHPDLRPSPALCCSHQQLLPGINIVTHNCTPHAVTRPVREYVLYVTQ